LQFERTIPNDCNREAVGGRDLDSLWSRCVQAVARWHRMATERPVARNLQIETQECGLACLSMAATLVGARIDLAAIRRRRPATAHGMSLQEVIDAARWVGFEPSAVRCNVRELRSLKKPAILHWNQRHYVLLTRIRRDGVTVFDPALGWRDLSTNQLANCFSGAAVLLTSTMGGDAKPAKRAGLLARVAGFRASGRALVLAGSLQTLFLAEPWVAGRLGGDLAAGRGLLGWGLLAGLVAVMEIGLDVLRVHLISASARHVGQAAGRALFHGLATAPMLWLLRRRPGDLIVRFDARAERASPARAFAAAGVGDAVMTAAALLAVAWRQPGLAAIAAAGLGVAVVFDLMAQRAGARRGLEARRSAAVERTVRRHIWRAIESVRATGAEARHEAVWSQLWAERLTAAAALAGWRHMLGALRRAALGLAVTVLGVVSWRLVFAGHSAPADAVAVAFCGAQLLRRGGVAMAAADALRTPARDAAGLGDLPPAPSRRPTRSSSRLDTSGMILEGVRFRYGPKDPEVISDVSLHVEPGEFIAVAGPPRSGKTTLARLMVGLCPPSAGRVTWNGEELSSLPTAQRSARVSGVLQRDGLFRGTVLENVSGFAEAPDEGRVWESLRQAQAERAVRALADGLATRVRTIDLPAGLQRRLQLARAFYSDAEVLVFDDPGLHLGPQQAMGVAEMLTRTGRTQIVFTRHREILQAADRAFWLVSGRLRAASRADGIPIRPSASDGS